MANMVNAQGFKSCKETGCSFNHDSKAIHRNREDYGLPNKMDIELSMDLCPVTFLCIHTGYGNVRNKLCPTFWIVACGMENLRFTTSKNSPHIGRNWCLRTAVVVAMRSGRGKIVQMRSFMRTMGKLRASDSARIPTRRGDARTMARHSTVSTTRVSGFSTWTRPSRAPLKSIGAI